MPTREKSHLLAYFTLCVCRPGLGSAWAGSLGPGTCLQEESLITVQEGNFVIDVCSTTGKPTHLFRTKCASLDSV
jgi:hypothetical protein